MAAIADTEKRNAVKNPKHHVYLVLSRVPLGNDSQEPHLGTCDRPRSAARSRSFSAIQRLPSRQNSANPHALAYLLHSQRASASLNCWLQWQDLDFSANTITPARGIIDNHVGGLKTAASAAAVPASKEVTDMLARWQEVTLYKEPTDWAFPSPKMGGKQPYRQDSLMRKVIWPAAKRAGITMHIGWHTFRRSLASFLVSRGADVKLTMEILRHANSRITLELYAQSTMPDKQLLQSQLVAKWAMPSET